MTRIRNGHDSNEGFVSGIFWCMYFKIMIHPLCDVFSQVYIKQIDVAPVIVFGSVKNTALKTGSAYP
jgi:hypothetical protein